MKYLQIAAIVALAIIALVCLIGYTTEAKECMNSGGEYMRTILGAWRCVK